MIDTEMTPWTLPWQQQPWQKFQQAFLQNKLHHAWIIEANENYAVDIFTEALMQLVNCQQLENNNPCKHCNSCQQITNGNYADVYRLNVLDKKTRIGVDQIREVNTALTKKAYSGGYRVVVVEQAELMNAASANAFLKTLEEPGEKTLTLLQTGFPSRLLPTLRSRCQQISLTHASQSELRNWLLQSHPSKEDSIDEALKAASFQPLLAVQFLEGDLLQQRSNVFANLDQLLQGQSTLQQFEQNNTMEHEQLLGWFEQYLLDKAQNMDSFKHKLNQFYGVLQEIRLQFRQVRDADKPLLLREILIKWIALSANMSHS